MSAERSRYEDVNLPGGVRKRIRRLKEQGKVEKATVYRENELKKAREKRRQRNPRAAKLQDTLDEKTRLLDEIEDPKDRATENARIVWLKSELGDITSRERVSQLMKISDEHPKIDISKIRKEVRGLA